jgi:type I restriction enzyme S subunit
MTKTDLYLQTPVGLIPSNWEVKRIKDIGHVTSGGTPDTSVVNYWNGDINWCTPTDISALKNKYLGETMVKITAEGLKNSSAKILPPNSIIVCTRATIGKAAINTVPMSTNQGFKNIVPIDVDTDFLYYKIISEEKGLIKIANGSTFLEVSKTDFDNYLLSIPPLPEQKKIASILSTWDMAIDIASKIILELRKRKIGLGAELLSGKKRLIPDKENVLIKNKGFRVPKNWIILPMSKLVKQIKNPIIVEKSVLYKQIGIRSHAKGIFYKEAVSGLSLGKKSVFKIEPDCFIVNIVFAWEHAIAKTTINEVGMIASHRFPMYKPIKEELDLDYLLHFFKSKKGRDLLVLASPGGAGRNKTLGQSEFMKLQIPVPSIEEQRKIATCLDKVDEQILLYRKKLSELQLQKKGLMQQLLTGQVRTKVGKDKL